MFHILPKTKIFNQIYTSMLIRINIFLLILPKPVKIACFYDFLAENRFLPILCVYFQYVENFEVTLTLYRHIDVIGRRMLLNILVSIEREES